MKLALANFDNPWLPISGLIIFLICFTLFTYWTLRKDNKSVYDYASMIPLEEDKKDER